MKPTSLYRHFDADGRLLYVGISLSPIVRLAQHADGSSWSAEIKRVEIETFPNRDAAHEAERAAIEAENPVHNLLRYDRAPGQTAPISLRVTDEFKSATEKAASEDGRSLASYVERVLALHLKEKGYLPK